MGFFSWQTQDTHRSIPNKYSSRKTFTVYMIDDKGMIYKETDYNGYGVFGGKDFFVLLAEMNCLGEGDNDDVKRSKGLGLAFDGNPSGDKTEGVKYPNLVREHIGWKYKPEGPLSCRNQGYFY